MPDFESEDAVVLGVSADSVESHERFARKNNLRILLLSDPERSLIRTYGAWGKKKMAGKEYEGIIRSTFLIDTEGVVRWIWPKVKIPGHAEEVLEALQKLKRGFVPEPEAGGRGSN
jgi:peroxiredoxin Q/BCP